MPILTNQQLQIILLQRTAVALLDSNPGKFTLPAVTANIIRTGIILQANARSTFPTEIHIHRLKNVEEFSDRISIFIYSEHPDDKDNPSWSIHMHKLEEYIYCEVLSPKGTRIKWQNIPELPITSVLGNLLLQPTALSKIPKLQPMLELDIDGGKPIRD